MAEISERQLKVLEKLIADEEFRAGFLEDPDTAISRTGIELAEEELAGLRGLDFGLLQSTLTDLDTRLSKSASPSDMATDLLARLSGLVSSR
jgi:hypothetical protein